MKKLLGLNLFILVLFASCQNRQGASNIKKDTLMVDTVAKKSEQINVKEPDFNCAYSFKGDSIAICLHIEDEPGKKGVKTFTIQMDNGKDSKEIKGNAKLITLGDDGEGKYLPEGSPIFDEVNNEDYICDSTFSFISKELNMSFGFEKGGAKRISFNLYQSKIPFLKDQTLTLRQSK